MNDLEKELRALPRAAPPAALDARVRNSLQQHGWTTLGRPVPLWACALAALLGLGGGLALRRQPAPAARTAPEARVVLVAAGDAGLPPSPFHHRRFVDSEDGAP